MQTHVNIQFTSHWIIDVGLATIAALANRQHVSDLNVDDLKAAADHIKTLYCHHMAMRNYLSVIFTNSHFVQAAMSDDDREAYADMILYAFQNDHPFAGNGFRCPFFPQLAAVFTAFRQHIPLLNGEGISNFSPAGRAGLPISGLALLATHAMPLGCAKCGGQLLAFHQLGNVDDPTVGKMTMVLAKEAWREKLGYLNLSSPTDKGAKLPSVRASARTKYVQSVIKAQQETQERDLNIDYITGYYFTNYGPSPKVELVRLDHTVLRFIRMVVLDAPVSWERAVHAAWHLEKGEMHEQVNETGSRRNYLYEQLFTLPDKPLAFLNRLQHGKSWKLITIFLREVMLMELERIETYRRLGDMLFDYVKNYENQPLSFYTRFSRAKAYITLRSIIRSAAERMHRANAETIMFTYDDFVLAFEHPSEAYSQWKLARDLISIRLLERLSEAKVDFSDMPVEDSEDEDKEDS
jgi:CRISPR-associated protein Cst1